MLNNKLVLGIDAGYRKCGICFLTPISIEFVLVKSSIEDYAKLYKSWYDEFWYVNNAFFVFIEDVIYLPKRRREIQAMLFGQIALILSRISEESGYCFVSPWKVKKYEVKNIEKWFDKIDEKDREHLIDAYKVIRVGLYELEEYPKWCEEQLVKFEENMLESVNVSVKELK